MHSTDPMFIINNVNAIENEIKQVDVVLPLKARRPTAITELITHV